MDNIRMNRLFFFIEKLNKAGNTTFITKLILNFVFRISLICEDNIDSSVQKSLFPQSFLQNFILVFGCIFENFRIGKKTNRCAGFFFWTIPFYTHIDGCFAAFKPFKINFSFMIDFYFQPGRKCIYNRSTNPV